jgi:hypothetical protein
MIFLYLFISTDSILTTSISLCSTGCVLIFSPLIHPSLAFSIAHTTKLTIAIVIENLLNNENVLCLIFLDSHFTSLIARALLRAILGYE